MSCPIVSPATWLQASASATRSAWLPITTTSSTSQSTVVETIGTSSNGPESDAGNLVKVAGTAGTSIPDSSAWLR